MSMYASEYGWPIPMFSIQPEPFQHISTLPIDFRPVLQDLRVGPRRVELTELTSIDVCTSVSW